jgi:hypothetical protein
LAKAFFIACYAFKVAFISTFFIALPFGTAKSIICIGVYALTITPYKAPTAFAFALMAMTLRTTVHPLVVFDVRV